MGNTLRHPIQTSNNGSKIITNNSRIIRPECCKIVETSEQFIPNCNKQLSTKEKTVDWLRCKQNILYWIYNYAFLPESGTGGTFKITPDNLNKKMKMVIRAIHRYHKVVLTASRQLGKSSVAALLIAHSLIFFPKIKVIVLNMKKTAALNNLLTIKHIIQTLPSWMVTGNPFKSKSDIKSYLILFNDSRVDVFYPSTVHTASTLARSLTSPILYIDEAAFITHMDDIFASAQQTLSKAREQAIKNNIPYYILTTSTP